MKFHSIAFPAACVALGSLYLMLPTAGAVPGTYGSTQDPSSYGNVDQFRPSHMELDYAISFDDKATFGTITHTLTVLESVMDVYFDIWDAVDVSMAEFKGPGSDVFEEVEFNITTPNPNIGNALGVALPVELGVGDEFYVRFTYRSLPETTALDWLSAEMTHGKTMPFVYSLCQMNFCRDWMPMIDSPSQKITYNATIVAPSEFVVSMSGNETGKMELNDTHTATMFECALKIPSYQIALIVGDLVSEALTDRVIIFAEPGVIDAAVAEFEDIPLILNITETYLGPYIWGVYSTFVMPPSFPWGGMEHINANQISPTLITGDKSMLGTVIHELTHSWFGNDIGCQNWDNFWINEGINVWMERKVMEVMYGEAYVKIEYANGNTSMYFDDMLYFGLNNTYSSLFPDIGDANPEDSFSKVPYEKGSQFMYWIETLLGKDAFQLFIRAYVGEFTQMAINSPMMFEFYTAWVTDNFPNNATEIINMTDWDTWVYVPGVAPTLDEDTFAAAALDVAGSLSQAYIEVYVDSGTPSSPDNYLEYEDFIAAQRIAFVQALRNADGMGMTLMEHIDNDFNITFLEVNPFLKKEWFHMGLEQGYEPVMEPLYAWMGEQGRHAFVSSTFRLLTEVGMCDTALSWYADYNMTYNSYVRGKVESYLEACNVTAVPDVDEPDVTLAPIESPTLAPSAAHYTSTASGVSLFIAVVVGLIGVWSI